MLPLIPALLPPRRLQQPRLPCVNVGTPRKPTLLPMELTHIAKGQRKAPAKVSDAQRRKMLDIATMAPKQHLGVVRQTLANAGMASEPGLRAFKLAVLDQPVEVCAMVPAGLPATLSACGKAFMIQFMRGACWLCSCHIQSPEPGRLICGL